MWRSVGLPWLLTLAMLPAAEPARGSLIVGVPIRSGWVVCSDKRVISPMRGVRDDETKLFAIRPGLAFGVTGFQRMIESVDGELVTRFSVADVVRDRLAARPFSGSPDDVRGLGDAILSAFTAYLADAPDAALPPLDGSVASGFSVAVFWVDRSGPSVATLRVPFRQPLAIDVSSSRGVVENRIRPVAFGNTRVWLELERGKRPDFTRARADAAIRVLFAPDPDRPPVSRPDAERFARRMIALTSEMNPLLAPPPSDVGPTIDCLQVAR